MAGSVAPVANGWRGESLVTCGVASIRLRCTMNTLATILDALDCETLIDVFRKWDGLSPEAMEKTLDLLAQSPAEAKLFWKSVDGLRGLQKLRGKFYEITSGQTPQEIKVEDENRKKLETYLAQKSATEIDQIVEALNPGKAI